MSATAGLASFLLLGSQCDFDFSGAACDAPDGSLLGLVLAGAVVGALIGAGIGATIPKGWRLRYARGPATAEVGLAPTMGIACQIRVQL